MLALQDTKSGMWLCNVGGERLLKEEGADAYELSNDLKRRVLFRTGKQAKQLVNRMRVAALRDIQWELHET